MSPNLIVGKLLNSRDRDTIYLKLRVRKSNGTPSSTPTVEGKGYFQTLHHHHTTTHKFLLPPPHPPSHKFLYPPSIPPSITPPSIRGGVWWRLLTPQKKYTQKYTQTNTHTHRQTHTPKKRTTTNKLCTKILLLF